MTIRHKAVKESLDIGYVSEWNDDHHIDFADELMNSWSFASTNLPDEFTTSVSGSAVVDVAMSSNHNWLNLVTGATANSVGSVILGDDDTTNKLDLPIFTTAIKLESNDLAEFGFFTYAGTPFTANQKGAYFRVKDDKVYAVTGNGANETETELASVSTYAQYRIEFTSTDVRFYINDFTTIKATHTLYITADDLTLKISIKNQDTTGRVLRVDGLGITRLRKK